MSHTPRHLDRAVKRRRLIRTVAISMVTVLVATLTGGYLVYRHLEGNITVNDITDELGDDRPEKVVKDTEHQPLNILLLGSDTREGAGNNIGGETPGLSDTTILLHISANRENAYGVSIPRDAMVNMPSCKREDRSMSAAGLQQFNAAYAIGGPGCTAKTIEQITDIRMDNYVVVDFNGFKNMVDALGGVEVCLPEEVNDTTGHINLPAGTYTVKGDRALDYVRVRYAISENGDIGRMKRQQTFLAAMSNKALSAGTLINPVRLYNFLDAATESLTTDFEGLNQLAGLAQQLKGIGLDNVQFLTVPFESYAPDPNRLQLKQPEANQLFERLRNDEMLTKSQSKDVTTAKEGTPGGSASKSPEAAAEAKANGLCA